MHHTRTRPLLAALAAVGVATAGLTAGVSTAPSAEAAPVQIRVVQHNLAKLPGALTAVIAKKNATSGPEVITMQEVCGSMRDRIEKELGKPAAWHVRRTGHCADGSNIGEIAVWTGGDVLDTTVRDLTPQAGQPSDQTYGVACVVFRYGGKKNKACSTHLAAGDPMAGVRAGQTAELGGLAAGWMADGTRVILGGDFNTTPEQPAMSAIYGVGTGAAGSFREVHQAATGNTFRGGKPTLWQDRKIDYVFGSLAGFAADGGSESTCNSTKRDPQGCTPSNHRILWGTLKLA
jgi:endonuclease/exonuclease/phosphatase family metal-dependent hydrolase